jgi:hypothetical protein
MFSMQHERHTSQHGREQLEGYYNSLRSLLKCTLINASMLPKMGIKRRCMSTTSAIRICSPDRQLSMGTAAHPQVLQADRQPCQAGFRRCNFCCSSELCVQTRVLLSCSASKWGLTVRQMHVYGLCQTHQWYVQRRHANSVLPAPSN